MSDGLGMIEEDGTCKSLTRDIVETIASLVERCTGSIRCLK